MKTYLRILRYLKPYWPQFLGSILLTLLFSTSNVYVMPWIKDVTKQINHKNLGDFAQHMLNGVGLWIVRVVTQYGQYYLMTWISTRIVIDIQKDVYGKLQGVSQHFYMKWKLGDLTTRLFSDSTYVRQTVMASFSDVLPQTLTFFGVLGYLFMINWKLTLFACVAVPLFIYLLSSFTERFKRVNRQMQRKSADIAHIAQENLGNIKLVQAYTMEKQEFNKFVRHSMKNFRSTMRSAKLKASMDAIVTFSQGLVFLSILYLGGVMVANSTMSGPTLVSFFTGLVLLIDPVSALSKVYVNIQQGMVSAERLFEVLDAPVVIANPEHGRKEKVKGHVVFKSVSFSYPEQNRPVLSKISLEAKEGQIIALVGLSGAGKSTLINLIPRFYDPTSGDIYIDDIALKDWDLHALRSQIGMVLQDDILFNGTVLENIRYGSQGATESDVEEAAKKANAWEFISASPQGLRSKVGDKGRRLSGGQKQRISIARAILRNPRILILDEATSALDSKSEKLVQEALIELMKNRTTFVIAHRLSTVMHAHKIIVMDKGGILEVGTHHELLEKEGQYATLFHLQFKLNEQKETVNETDI